MLAKHRRTCPIRKAFAIPVYYYDQFMQENGFYDAIDALLADPSFVTDPAARDAEARRRCATAMMRRADRRRASQALLKAKLADATTRA